MATYVTLANFTDQGIRNFKDTPKRAQAFREMVSGMGGEVVDMYWTMGGYDLVAITRFADDEMATAAALQISALGNVRTTTMRAFDVAEMERIIGSIG
jgi:uncharacterized protein with GYD domain